RRYNALNASTVPLLTNSASSLSEMTLSKASLGYQIHDKSKQKKDNQQSFRQRDSPPAQSKRSRNGPPRNRLKGRYKTPLDLCFAALAGNQVGDKLLRHALTPLIIQRLYSQFPGFDNQLIHFPDRQIGRDVQVQALGLINVFLPDGSLLNDLQLTYFLECFEYRLFLLTKSVQVLDAAVIQHNAPPDLFVVHSLFDQKLTQVFVFAHEITFRQPGFIVIAAVGFDPGRSLPQNGGRGCGGRNSHQGGVSSAVAAQNLGLSVNSGQFDACFFRLFPDVFENGVCQLFGLQTLKGDFVPLQVGMPAHHA